MESKEFLKKAGIFMKSFLSGVKEALGIRSPSLPFEPKPKEGFNEKIMQPATMAGYEKVMAEFQSIPEEMTPSPEVDDTLKNASMQIELTGYPAQEVAEALLRASESCLKTTNSIDQLIAILRDFRGCPGMRRLAMENTNNWRRMHGLPMRRRTLQERRRISK